MQEACDKKLEAAITSFVADGGLRAAIRQFKDEYPIKISVSAACGFLIRKGLEAVKAEKEAARG